MWTVSVDVKMILPVRRRRVLLAASCLFFAVLCLLAYLRSIGILIHLVPAALPDAICRWANDPGLKAEQNRLQKSLFNQTKTKFKFNPNESCPKFRGMAEAVRMQILSDVLATNPAYLPKQLVTIIDRHAWSFRQLLPIRYATNRDDIKFYADYYDSSKSNCTIITLGIGGDIQAEKTIKRKLPNCDFYGADPVPKFGEIYNEIGEYFPLAVSNEKSLKFSMAMKSYKVYEKRKVQHVNLADFILNYVKRPIVDLLLLDAEGAEYLLMPMFKRGGKLEANGIIICQVTMEIHTPMVTFANKSSRMWAPIITDFLLNTDLLPIWADKQFVQHRLYLINPVEPKCLERYYGSLC